MKFTTPNAPLAGPQMLFTDPRMRSPTALGAFGDAGDGPAMDAVLSTLNTDMTKAQVARATSFLAVNGASIDSALSNYQNMINILSGTSYQAVLAGTTPFSSGNTDAPGWLETAQSIEDGLASTTGVIGRTDLSSLAKNAGAALPNLGPGSLPWWAWLAIGLGGLVVLSPVLVEAVGWSKIARRKHTHGYRRRRK